MTTVLHRASEVLYLFAPLLLSAALSGLVMRLDWFRCLRRPIDAGLTWHGRRVFGDSKTWRGVAVAVAGCILGASIQRYLLAPFAQGIARIDYDHLDVFTFGAAMGSSAMLGELPNSFVKRSLGIAPGKTTEGWLAAVFYVWDQIDLLTFSWLVLSCWIEPDWSLIATSVGITLALHPFVSLVGYLMGARRTAR